MITKIISCADVHIPFYKNINDVTEVLSSFIKQCDKISEENGRENTRIVVAGDLIDSKINISNEQILALHWFLSELNKICKTIVIAGNHDFLMNNLDRVDSISPLFEIGEYENVIFLDKELNFESGILNDDNVAWCLYSSFAGFNTPDIAVHKEAMKGVENAPVTYIGLIHGDVNGAITATNFVAENGIDPGVFEGCDFVIAGHIHKRQEIKKNGVRVVYCSSIRQREFGESISGHGFVLWDIEDPEEIEYKFVDVPNPDGGFFKFEVNGIEDIQDDNEELINY